MEISDFSSLSSLGGGLTILFNNQLTSVDGLESITVVNGRLWIRENDMLDNIDGLSGVTTINDFLGIDNNDVLSNIDGLSSLTTVNEEVAIEHNAMLQNLDGLSSLNSVGAWLYIIHNDALTEIDGLSSLTFIPRDLLVRNNENLTNLNGVSATVSIGEDLRIYDNPSLVDCCGLYPVLESMNVTGNINIYNNPATCSNPAEVLSSCEPTSYCTSSSDFPWHEWVSKVQLHTIDHSSGKTFYSDFTAQNTTLQKGNSYPVSLQTTFSWDTYDEYYRIWIDFNHNGDFTDPGEMVLNTILNKPPDGTPPVMLNGNIAIPNSALTGATRMRVALQRGSAPTPCATIPFGEVEDYTVTLSGAATPVLDLECPDDIQFALPANAGGINVSWDLPTYSTTCPTGAVSLTQTGGLFSGNFFPLGIYNITYTATDDCGNQEDCFFTIFVEELEEYCDLESEYPWHDWIGAVHLAGMSHGSAKSTYSDFTVKTAFVDAGGSYPIKLVANYSYETYDEYWKVWIDYNQNNQFEEPAEVAYAGVLNKPADGTGFKVLDGTISVPSDALPGATRMRVAMQREAYAEPCGVFEFGEVEDYTVVVNSSTISPLAMHERLLLEARIENGVVAVEWATNTSYKNDYFIVERSTDDLNYEPIFEVDNGKDGDQYIYHQHQDQHPEFGKNYYRIKQYAMDGSFSYSNVEAIDYHLDPNQFTLFPNPVQQELFVNARIGVGQSAVLQIQDIYGRILLEKRITELPDSPVRIDVTAFENGLYFLNFKVKDRKMMSRKFVVGRTQ